MDKDASVRREDILKRLARAPATIDGDLDVVTVDNSGELEAAIADFINVLEELTPESA